ncbi:MAG: GNAT family N-acetyltransferase [Desulfitobacteriaceae bacterium]
MRIEAISSNRERFLELLLIADPSEVIVRSYFGRGHLFVLFEGDEAYGVVHLDPLRDNVMEIKNIAIQEGVRGKGRGSTMWF